MNASRLTWTLGLAIGIASASSSQIWAQKCDGACDSGTCTTCCDDSGLLDRLGAATTRLESRLRAQLLHMAHRNPNACDSPLSQCDALPGGNCSQCSSQPSENRNSDRSPTDVTEPNHSHSRPVPSPIPAPQITPRPNSDIHHGSPVPPPHHGDPMDDSKVDPFRDDTALYWRSSPGGQRRVGYMRRISGGSDAATGSDSRYADAFSPQASSGYHRSIASGHGTRDLSNHSRWSNEQSSRHFARQQADEYVDQDQVVPPSMTEVVPASAVIPVSQIATARISDVDDIQATAPRPATTIRRASYGEQVPHNPLRTRAQPFAY